MKLDPKTVAILENFAQINPRIVIKPGNELRTMSPASESVFAFAKVAETFPREFAILDINQFLGILSLDKDSDIQFEDKYLIIKQGKSSIRYVYAEPSLIVQPPEGEPSADWDITFNLSVDDLTKTMKALSILKHNEIAFVGKDGVLSVAAINSKDTVSTASFSTEIGATDKEFCYIIEADTLKLIKQNYAVSITSAGISRFKADDVEYWIALSTKSTVNGQKLN
jgi:hypothetical protein